MNIRMHRSPVLSLPETSQNQSPKSNKRRSRNGSAKQGGSKPLVEHRESKQQEAIAKPIAKQQEAIAKPIAKQQESNAKPIAKPATAKQYEMKQKESIAKQSGEEPKVSMMDPQWNTTPKSKKRHSTAAVDKVDKKKKKKLRMNDVSLDRCSAQADKALESNPLLENCISFVNNEVDDHEGLDSTVPVIEDSEHEEETGCISETAKSEVKVAGSGLPNTVQDMSSAGSSSESDSSSSSSESDDEVVKLSTAKDVLQQQVDLLKKQLSECKRDLTLANNLRVAYKDQCSELKEELQIKSTQIKTLEKRNSTLQDLLCHKFSAPTDSKFVHDPEPMNKYLLDSEYDKKKHSPSTECFDPETTSTTSTPNLQSPLCSPTPPGSEKKSKKSKENLEENKVINEVCDKVLLHLKGDIPLPVDKQGFIDLGPVQLDKLAMEKHLQDHKGDVQKIAKGMATLAWSPLERAERSLEGGRNNRYPNAPPKKAATPIKVNACLGIVKAHLLHEGERDGSGLRQNLKLGRRAIGARFSQDYSQAKK